MLNAFRTGNPFSGTNHLELVLGGVRGSKGVKNPPIESVRVRRCWKSHGSSAVGSEDFGILLVGPGYPDPIRPARRGPTRKKRSGYFHPIYTQDNQCPFCVTPRETISLGGRRLRDRYIQCKVQQGGLAMQCQPLRTQEATRMQASTRKKIARKKKKEKMEEREKKTGGSTKYLLFENRHTFRVRSTAP